MLYRCFLTWLISEIIHLNIREYCKKKVGKEKKRFPSTLCDRWKYLACPLMRNPAAVQERATYRDIKKVRLVAQGSWHTGRGKVDKSEMKPFREQSSPFPSEAPVETITFFGRISSGSSPPGLEMSRWWVLESPLETRTWNRNWGVMKLAVPLVGGGWGMIVPYRESNLPGQGVPCFKAASFDIISAEKVRLLRVHA